MGFRQPVRRSTLALMPTERRDWRIHAVLAQRLITQARTLYWSTKNWGWILANTVYALDSTTIDSVPVGLSVGALPHHQGGGEDAHAASTCGRNIPSFIGTSRMASCTTFMPSRMLDKTCRKPEPSTSPGSWLRRLCPPLCVAPSRGLLRHACQVEHRCSSSLFGADGSLDRHHLRPDHLPGRLLHPSGLRRTSAAHPLQGRRVRQDAGLHHQQLLAAGRHHAARSTKSRWQVELFFKWIKQHHRIKQFYGTSENAVKTQIWIAILGLRPRRHRQEAPRPGRLALHFVTDPLGDPLRENAHTSSHLRDFRFKQMQRLANSTNQLNLFDF